MCVCSFMHTYLCMYHDIHVSWWWHVCRPEDDFRESVLSFHSLGPRDQPQIVRLANEHPLCLLGSLIPTSTLCSEIPHVSKKL